MLLSFTRSLRWKVGSDVYAWLKRKWMSGFDLCNLTAGATDVFDNLGADTIQSGWIPFKAASLKRKGVCLRFAGKRVRVFQLERLEGVKWRAAA